MRKAVRAAVAALVGLNAAVAAHVGLSAAAATAETGPAGFYHIAPQRIVTPYGPSYGDYHALFEDGTWRFERPLECRRGGEAVPETVIRRTGTWRMQHGRLVLHETAVTRRPAGPCRCDPLRCGVRADPVSAASDRTVTVEPAAGCAVPDQNGLPCLTIDGVTYFRLGRAEAIHAPMLYWP